MKKNNRYKITDRLIEKNTLYREITPPQYIHIYVSSYFRPVGAPTGFIFRVYYIIPIIYASAKAGIGCHLCSKR